MQDRKALRLSLIEIMEADTGESYQNLDDSKNLRVELGMDSVDVISIISNVERKYHLHLAQQELAKLVTFGDVVDLLEVKLREAEAASNQPLAA